MSSHRRDHIHGSFASDSFAPQLELVQHTLAQCVTTVPTFTDNRLVASGSVKPSGSTISLRRGFATEAAAAVAPAAATKLSTAATNLPTGADSDGPSIVTQQNSGSDPDRDASTGDHDRKAGGHADAAQTPSATITSLPLGVRPGVDVAGGGPAAATTESAAAIPASMVGQKLGDPGKLIPSPDNQQQLKAESASSPTIDSTSSPTIENVAIQSESSSSAAGAAAPAAPPAAAVPAPAASPESSALPSAPKPAEVASKPSLPARTLYNLDSFLSRNISWIYSPLKTKLSTIFLDPIRDAWRRRPRPFKKYFDRLPPKVQKILRVIFGV